MRFGLCIWLASLAAVRDATPDEVFRADEATFQELVDLADVVFVGTVTSTEQTIWLGPYLDEGAFVWDVTVTQEQKGRIESGRILVWDENGWDGLPPPGVRVLLIGAPKVFHLGRGTQTLFPSRPAYQDLVVPAVDGTMYWEGPGGELLGRSWPNAAPQTFQELLDRTLEAAQRGEPGVELAGWVDVGGEP